MNSMLYFHYCFLLLQHQKPNQTKTKSLEEPILQKRYPEIVNRYSKDIGLQKGRKQEVRPDASHPQALIRT